MDMVQADEEVEDSETEVALPEKAKSRNRIKALANCLLTLGYLMLLADGVGMVMVATSYHENLGVTMVILGLFSGVTFIGSAVFLQQRLQKNPETPLE